MRVIKTEISDVFICEPQIHIDRRGFFFEGWRKNQFDALAGSSIDFLQENVSSSVKGVLRGLHYQLKEPQGKLVHVSRGAVIDVVVDLRENSPHFGTHIEITLSEANKRRLWIPPGFAHGFATVSEAAELRYATTSYYNPSDEYTIRWDDPTLDIKWGDLSRPPMLSSKDEAGLSFEDAPKFQIPIA